MTDERALQHPNQATAPLYEALRAFVEREQAPFYSPGHKGGRTLDPWFREHIAELDLNNLPDTDTLHCPEGPILRAERLIADAWGVGHSFILVGGSTAGNIAVALSALRPGERVLVAAQRSQIGHRRSDTGRCATSLAGSTVGQPVRSCSRSGRGERRARLPREHATALWVLHPTYFGTTADIRALAATCERFDARLLVDSAHGPHFAFHPDLPVAAEQAGATATVQSIHKILSGLSQAAVLHVDPTALDPATVRRALQLIQTTSPHFAIMASIDLARHQMATAGREMLDQALARARRTALRLAAIPGLPGVARRTPDRSRDGVAPVGRDQTADRDQWPRGRRP